ncbi:glycosyltransferase [Microvirga tunisiensis]|uniref:Glycosyltransferase n=2 Tax=Pannonibacter tanglangensis TaxID=2750084 RepID=A0A7X5F382_9HYPH|nr:MULTISPECIES: glycosyltransferase [unclassified Pannonibacter]NBN64388.1 glycosyltransferase [Pannonibacter sp. XCT-34]NBN78921.1 glycosyltransferase [Pannonibacter sp. XCT-53]
MISVVISSLDNEEGLAHSLTALVPAAAEGIVREVVVMDGGSRDGSVTVADAAGCELHVLLAGEGRRYAEGAARAAKSPWLLFLPAGSVLEAGWHTDAASFVERAERSGQADRCAAAFHLRRDDFGLSARLSETAATLSTRLFGMPCNEQGLLVSRRLYVALGGHRDLAGLADLDIARRIGRSRLVLLRSAAIAPQRPNHGPRQTLARLAVTALRLPPRLAAGLHG